jgi:hypothetical protein
MSKVKDYEWLDRTLVRSPYHICLCTTEKAFNKVLKQLKIPKDMWPAFLTETMGACVHTFENVAEDLYTCVVCIRKTKYSKEEIYPLLVHESVHVLQNVWQFLGEHDPSDEFEAYAIQNISQNLMLSYKRQTSKKNKKGAK